MNYEEKERKEWKEKIRRKTRQVLSDYSRAIKNVPIEDALVGVLAHENAKPEIPRVILRDSEGVTDHDLIKAFSRVFAAMKTPTYQTINFTNPEAVQAVTEFCLRDSITDGYAERDACYVLWEVVGERPVVYWDHGRDLPQYAGEVLEKLDMQFGSARVYAALRQNTDFYRFLRQSMSMADRWTRNEDTRRGTTHMDAKDHIELGFIELSDYMSQDTETEEDAVYGAIDAFVRARNRELIPYRSAQYALRGVPVTTCNHRPISA